MWISASRIQTQCLKLGLSVLPEICFSSRVPLLPLLGKWTVHLSIYAGRNLAVIDHLFSFNFISSELPNSTNLPPKYNWNPFHFSPVIFLISFAASDVLIIYPEFSENSTKSNLDLLLSVCWGHSWHPRIFYHYLARYFPSSIRYSIIYILLLSLVLIWYKHLPNPLPIIRIGGKYFKILTVWKCVISPRVYASN